MSDDEGYNSDTSANLTDVPEFSKPKKIKPRHSFDCVPALEPIRKSNQIAQPEQVWSRIKKNTVFSKLYSFGSWEDPKLSGLILFSLLAVHYLMYFKEYSLLTVVVLLFLSFVICSTLWILEEWARERLSGKALNNPLKEKFTESQFIVTPHNVHHLSELISLLLTYPLVICCNILVKSNLVTTIKTLLVLTLLYEATLYISGIAFTFLFTLFWFSWPSIYKQFKTQIDSLLNTMTSKLKEIEAKATRKPGVRANAKTK